MIGEEKQRLRMKMLKLFREASPGDSGKHRRLLLREEVWKHASTVLLYSPLPGEPDPMFLIPNRAFRHLLFPRIEGEQLRLYRQKATSRWVTGSFGLKEPDPESWETASPGEVDLAFIPGLAFDRYGRRLGRGGGFYDRLLGHPDFQGRKIGLCWTWQLLPFIPCEEHDIRVHQIITEESLIFPDQLQGSMLDNSQERE